MIKKILWTACLLAICIGLIEYFRQVPLRVISKKLFFSTPASMRLQGLTADDGASEVRLLVVGDTGLGSAGQADVARLLERLCQEKQVHGVLMLGDNFYFNGVSSVEDSLWQERFHRYYDSACLSNLRFFAVLGNHDYDGSPSAQILYTQKSAGHFTMPARAYSVTIGNILSIAAIDSNFPDRCYLDFLCSLDWVERDLLESQVVWKIAMGHHPMMSGGKYPKPKPLARLTIPDFLCKNDIAVYFAGHDHNAQHLEGQRDGFPCSLRQVILGNGGADLVPVKNTQFTQFADSRHGAGYATFSSDQLSVAFYEAAEQRLVYSFSVSKKNMGTTDFPER